MSRAQTISVAQSARPRRRAPRARAAARRTSRGGLAPLELVLALPLLMMLMALMVNFAVTGAWKVRAATVARDMVWSNRWPRSGATAVPANWPTANASRGEQAGAAVSVLYNGSIDQPVARGPMLGTTQVNRNLLDPTLGLQIGESNLWRSMPMLAAALPALQFNLQHPLLDNAWQYQRMALASNLQRREPVIYQFPETDPSLSQAYVNAVVQLYYSPVQLALVTLDQDPEIFAFYGSYHDFHPRLAHFCSLDVQSIRQNQVQTLINHIQGSTMPPVQSVPQTMAQFFMNMYRQQLQMPGANAPALQAEIQMLQQYLSSL